MRPTLSAEHPRKFERLTAQNHVQWFRDASTKFNEIQTYSTKFKRGKILQLTPKEANALVTNK
jgi:hypothetical protein